MENKNIKINEETWWKLNKLKVDLRLTKLADVINYLIKNQKKR